MRRYFTSLAVPVGVITAALLYPGQSWSAGVAAGTQVSNVATVNYSVNGVAQDDIESSPTGNSDPTVAGTPTDFTVDRVIDLTLSQQDTANVAVQPNQTQRVTTFVLTNDSNEAQGYTFVATDLATGVSVNSNADSGLDLAPYTVWIDGGDGVFDGGTGDDTAAPLASLDPDVSVIVFVAADIPGTAADGDVANVELTATSVEPNTTTAPSASAANSEDGPADTVIRNGTASAQDGYNVEAASLTITKSQATIADGVNAAAPFFNIPGATIEFTIEIVNNGSQDATNVIITDTIAAELDVSGNTTVTITNGGPASCVVDIGDTNGDGCSRTDEGPGPVFAATDLVIDPGITVASGTTASVVITVVIR